MMEVLLNSAVICAIISGFLVYWESVRNSKLKYITEEREKWREKLRDITKELIKYKKPEDLIDILAEIKVRINTYGIAKKDVCKDEHIWNVIREIEDMCNNMMQGRKTSEQSLDKEVNKLIEYISLLLKHDWDRSKQEVNKGGILIFDIVMFFMVAYGFLAGYTLQIANSGKNQKCCVFLISILLVVVIIIIALIVISSIIYKKRTKRFNEEAEKQLYKISVQNINEHWK